MDFSKIKELKPYDLNCNIFDVYSYDGLSMQELLCQFFTKINECIKTSNETIDLVEWLVNEGLKQEVALKLTNWLNDGIFENLINVTLFENLNKKIDNVSSQLEHNVNKQIKCSELGMTTGDSGVNNFKILCEAIGNGFTILVDDIYPLSVSAIYPITTDINIRGLKNSYGFNMVNCSVYGMFSIQNSYLDISIDNISLNSNSQIMSIIHQENVKIKINNINITNCIFTNYMRCLFIKGDLNTNPDIVDYGVSSFKFNNNVVKNSVTSFMTLNDMPHEIVEVKNNKVNNFQYVFFNCAITNENSYNSKLEKAKRFIRVENNVVINDSYWFNGSGAGSYHCFIVFEGDTAVYEHNHVEGLKEKDKDVAVYDAYFSCLSLLYQHNYWKNNVCFSTTKQSHALMKAKGGLYGKKVYNHNQYYMDKYFHQQYGFSVECLKTKMFDNVTDSEWVITNNIIDIPYLTGQTSTSPYYRVDISNNIINSHNWNDSSLMCPLGGSDVTVCNNKITISNDTGFHLIKHQDDFPANSIIVNNNNIKVDNAPYLFYGVKSKEFICKDNDIEYNSTSTSSNRRLFVDLVAGKMVIKNNYVKSLEQHTTLLSMPIGMDIEYDITTMQQEAITGNTHNGFIFNVYNDEYVTTQPYRYNIEITINTESKRYFGHTTFKAYLEDGNRMIEYIDTSNENIIRNMDEDGDAWRYLLIDGELPIRLAVPKSKISSSLFGLFYLNGTVGKANMRIKISSVRL